MGDYWTTVDTRAGCARLVIPGEPVIYDYPDMLDRSGAEALVKRLTVYWAERGHPHVNFWLEPLRPREAIGVRSKGIFNTIYSVRSDLLAGRPRRTGA